ncbi:MAG: hypothetical protein M3540_01180 [Actinomycetota bacterium]|nr:hypothetical protein [Actinomycetota bacterium]
MSRTPLIRALVIGCLATVSLGCGAAEKLPGGKLAAEELGAYLERRNPGAGPYSCNASNGGWDYVCSYSSPRGEVLKVGVEVGETEPKLESTPVPVTTEVPPPPGARQTGRERVAFVHRVEAACTERENDLRRLKSPRTRSAYLASFGARRLAEAAFANSVRQIVPPKAGGQPFHRLVTAAQARVDAVDRFHNAVLARKLPEARAAFAETRSASVVIAREARGLGATCAA